MLEWANLIPVQYTFSTSAIPVMASVPFSFFCLAMINVCVASLQSEYKNKEILNSSPEYNLYWTYSSSQARLYFATEVETSGWIGLGFTYKINTNMDGYDVAIGYIVSGTSRTELKDFMTSGHTPPSIDTRQDFKLQSATNVGNKTILRFSRLVNTNDNKDVYIKPGPITVVWAYRHVAALGHHDGRGWKSVTFYTASGKGNLHSGSFYLIALLVSLVTFTVDV